MGKGGRKKKKSETTSVSSSSEESEKKKWFRKKKKSEKSTESSSEISEKSENFESCYIEMKVGISVIFSEDLNLIMASVEYLEGGKISSIELNTRRWLSEHPMYMVTRGKLPIKNESDTNQTVVNVALTRN